MNTTEIKKNLKNDFKTVTKIVVSIGESEGEFDINVNVWGWDRFMNDEFECYTETMTDEKKAITKAKRLATTLKNNGFKSTYEGIENC